MTITEKEEALLRSSFDAAVEGWWQLALYAFQVTVKECKSPIERLMLAALSYEFAEHHGDIFAPIWNWYERETPRACSLEPQKQIGPYSADFAITIMPNDHHALPARVVIECDGHAFHEKTKEQAAHDKARDRYMTERGWVVMRFTGSEIYADARACAASVERVVTKLLYAHNHDPLASEDTPDVSPVV